jgi:thiol-disulfide isomerase/thioredoxin
MKKLYSLLILVSLLAMNAGAQSIPKWKLNDLKDAIAKAEKPTIFNFWATSCKPCVEEIPYFQELVKKYDTAGLQLVLVNLDMPETYARLPLFAGKLKITHPIKFLDETNADLFCPPVDPKWSGAIPASLFVNGHKGYRKFFGDQLSKEDFEREVKALIKK